MQKLKWNFLNTAQWENMMRKRGVIIPPVAVDQAETRTEGLERREAFKWRRRGWHATRIDDEGPPRVT